MEWFKNNLGILITIIGLAITSISGITLAFEKIENLSDAVTTMDYNAREIQLIQRDQAAVKVQNEMILKQVQEQRTEQRALRNVMDQLLLEIRQP